MDFIKELKAREFYSAYGKRLRGGEDIDSLMNEANEKGIRGFSKDDVQKVSLNNKNGIIEILSKDDKLNLTIPENVKFDIDDTQLSDARDIINSFYFYDVKKALKKYSENLPTLSFEIKDGLVITISSINPIESGESWVLIDAISNDSKSEKLANEINQKTKGYEFLANIITSDILRWKLQDLAIKDKKS